MTLLRLVTTRDRPVRVVLHRPCPGLGSVQNGKGSVTDLLYDDDFYDDYQYDHRFKGTLDYLVLPRPLTYSSIGSQFLFCPSCFEGFVSTLREGIRKIPPIRWEVGPEWVRGGSKEQERVRDLSYRY